MNSEHQGRENPSGNSPPRKTRDIRIIAKNADALCAVIHYSLCIILID